MDEPKLVYRIPEGEAEGLEGRKYKAFVIADIRNPDFWRSLDDIRFTAFNQLNRETITAFGRDYHHKVAIKGIMPVKGGWLTAYSKVAFELEVQLPAWGDAARHISRYKGRLSALNARPELPIGRYNLT
ncbi:MAG: hypothetical protein KGQ41_09310 [Alphaproteobacteria bacterium]|nr:hypothetical protein [Alphaproteobacteria bacterium]